MCHIASSSMRTKCVHWSRHSIAPVEFFSCGLKSESWNRPYKYEKFYTGTSNDDLSVGNSDITNAAALNVLALWRDQLRQGWSLLAKRKRHPSCGTHSRLLTQGWQHSDFTDFSRVSLYYAIGCKFYVPQNVTSLKDSAKSQTRRLWRLLLSGVYCIEGNFSYKKHLFVCYYSYASVKKRANSS